MNIEDQILNLSLLYSAKLIAFTIAILLSLKRSIVFPSILWIFANIFASLGVIDKSVFVQTEDLKNYNLFGFFMSGLSIVIAYFAVASGRHKSFHFQNSHSVFIVALTILLITPFLPYGWFPSVLGFWGASAITFATAWVCFRSRLWRGLWGQAVLVAGLSVCALILVWRGWLVFDGRVGTGFRVDPEASLLGLQLLTFTSFFMQFGFFALIGGRELRLRRFMARRAARLFEVGKEMALEEKRLAVVAEERLFGVGLLTHEVRQPINNARAALEALDFEIKPDSPNAAASKEAIRRAQSVLDAITLATSNAIFGAKILEDDQALAARPFNAYEVAELAKFDCPLDLTPRIELTVSGDAVYVDIDPILVRLAVRNLLDNALKYSPSGSPVQLNIVQREDQFGVSFTVTSQMSRPDLLGENIFERRARGSGARGQGSGLGLFLVKKVADAHHGRISYAVHDETKVTFDLFIPD
jgi:signal transduction histidine kinase